MGTETSKSDTGGPTFYILINTDNVEGCAVRVSDMCQDMRSAYGPIPEARERLTALNTDGCLTKALQHLYDAEVSFFKHTGQLETAAVMLRNIAVNYDNTEQLLLGGDIRDMMELPKTPEIGPYDPGPNAPEEEKKVEKKEKYDKPELKWDKREYNKKWDKVDTWYEYLFDSKHKINIGQKKKWHSPTDGTGRYTNQRQLSWNVGLTWEKGKYDPQWFTNKMLKESGLREEKIIKGDEKFAPKKIGTLFEVSAGVSASWTGLGKQRTIAGDHHFVFGEAYIARTQASAQAGIGAYMYQTKDGRYVQAYGLSASVGASFTVAGMGVSGDYGIAALGVGGSGEVKVIDCYAKADALIGMVDGKFNAVVTGGVGAELVSASISPTFRMLGVEVSASVGVTVGLGAKFEVGIHDGKLKANIGATLGIGVDISFSFDFSKCISVAKDIGNGIVSAARAVGRGIASLASTIFRRW